MNSFIQRPTERKTNRSISSSSYTKYPERLATYLHATRKARLHNRMIDLIDQYAEILHNDADHGTALAAFADAVDLAPNEARCHNNLAVFYWRAGDLEKSILHLKHAREIDPYDRETVWNCGQVMMAAGEPLLAKHTYSDYIRHRGYDEDMSRAIANLQ